MPLVKTDLAALRKVLLDADVRFLFRVAKYKPLHETMNFKRGEEKKSQ
jgi:hypothetical protein